MKPSANKQSELKATRKEVINLLESYLQPKPLYPFPDVSDNLEISLQSDEHLLIELIRSLSTQDPPINTASVAAKFIHQLEENGLDKSEQKSRAIETELAFLRDCQEILIKINDATKHRASLTLYIDKKRAAHVQMEISAGLIFLLASTLMLAAFVLLATASLGITTQILLSHGITLSMGMSIGMHLASYIVTGILCMLSGELWRTGEKKQAQGATQDEIIKELTAMNHRLFPKPPSAPTAINAASSDPMPRSSIFIDFA